MKRNAKRRMLALGAASALSVGGIVYLAVKASDLAPGWALTAVASPVAIRCLFIMAVCIVALGLLAAILLRASAARSGGSKWAGRPTRVLADEGGTAALEMVLVLPIALVIFLVITQATLLFNANMVVHYAGFAAARVATVVVPLEIGEELPNLVYNPDVATNPPSEKLELIRRAAVLALVPISASVRLAGDDELGPARAVEAQTRALFKYFGAEERPWFHRIRNQYNYADRHTRIEMEKPSHWRGGDPDEHCPYRHYQRGAWTQWGWSYISYCPFYDERMDYWYWEDLHLKVTYKYLLGVPLGGPAMGRVIGEEVRLPGQSAKFYCAEIEVESTLSNEGGPERRRDD